MGSCSAQKEKQKPPQQDIKIIEVPIQTQNQKVLNCVHKMDQLLELVGDVDQLDSFIKEKLNYLISLNSNIHILIHHQIRKILNEKNIIRKPTIDDEEYLDQNLEFARIVQSQIRSVIKCLEQLQEEEEFERAFPILSVSYFQLLRELKSLHQLKSITQATTL